MYSFFEYFGVYLNNKFRIKRSEVKFGVILKKCSKIELYLIFKEVITTNDLKRSGMNS